MRQTCSGDGTGEDTLGAVPDIEVEVTPGEHERWIVAYLRRRYPALEAQHRAAYEAFRAYLRTGRIDEADFLKIVGVARSTHAGLWGTGTDWLARLTREHPPAHDALRAMARDKVAQVRFNAL